MNNIPRYSFIAKKKPSQTNADHAKMPFRLVTVSHLILMIFNTIYKTIRHSFTSKKSFPLMYPHTSPTFRPTKHPIVLCHGLFGYHKLGPDNLPFLQLRYWAAVEDCLKKLGCQVYTPKVGSASSLKTRAHELRRFLDQLSEEKDIRSFNIIGHSMGGLDARYVISHLQTPNFRIESLLTLGTPHHGSSFMDYLRDQLGLGSKRPVWNEVTVDHKKLSKLSKSKNAILKVIFSPIDAPAFYNLTTEYCAAFNQVSPNHPATRYYSYASKCKINDLTEPLHYSQLIVQKYEGDNDGIVSVKSAQWGEVLGVLDCNHWSYIPSNQEKATLFLQISEKLSQQGL